MTHALRVGALSLVLIAGCAPLGVRSSTPRAKLDPTALALLGRVEAKMLAARTVDMERASTIRRPNGTAGSARVFRVRLERPDRYRIETVAADSAASKEFIASLTIANGRLRYIERPGLGGSRGARGTLTVAIDDENYVWDDETQTLAGLYALDDEHPGIGHEWRMHKVRDPNVRGLSYVGREKWNGETYDVVEWKYDIGYYLPEYQVRYSQRLYIGHDTIIRRVVTTTSRGHVLEDVTRRIDVGASFPDSLFTIAAPKDTAIVGVFGPGGRGLKVGDIAPDFTIPSLGRDSISLSRELARSKAVVLWFWGYG